MSESAPPSGARPARRDLLVALLAGAVGAGAGIGASAVFSSGSGREAATDEDGVDSVQASGRTQAGIDRPGTPQRFGRLMVFDIDRTASAPDWLRTLGARILEATTGEEPDAVIDLTVTVGVGPALVAILDPTLPGAEDLPEFRGDADIPSERRGGDLLLTAYGSDPGALRPVLLDLAADIPGAVVRWEQALFRGPGSGTRVRNPLGFHDGIVVPHGEEQLDENVWLADGPLAGGTVCVVRRLRLDIDGFRSLPIAEQERIIGRRRIDGAPLSGGEPDDDVDLNSRTPEGDPVIDAHAHVRAAHPSFTGSKLMLRRGYAFDDGAADTGLMFICFQRDLRTFVATQYRLDEVDALSAFSTPTASGTFLILPGFDQERPLGSTLSATT
ncbi:Dyp-type peroxidase [Pseudolysinimonas sp.]|uniref:Dyp-type peroxidase n=1 Tax=Pseudolysinimonas sp. TaxID=2680009 RepID=UPI00286B2959|nr:Dyp-type peroxidase [Pseudolysinimonas sp.]